MSKYFDDMKGAISESIKAATSDAFPEGALGVDQAFFEEIADEIAQSGVEMLEAKTDADRKRVQADLDMLRARIDTKIEYRMKEIGYRWKSTFKAITNGVAKAAIFTAAVMGKAAAGFAKSAVESMAAGAADKIVDAMDGED